MRPAPLGTPRRPFPPGGFTLMEIQVAVLLLAVGVGAILGTAVLDIRMVGRGRQTTRAVLAAAAQIESLRALAAAPGYCAGVAAGADTLADSSVVRWTLPGAGAVRLLTVTVTYPVAGALREDSLSTLLGCP